MLLLLPTPLTIMTTAYNLFFSQYVYIEFVYVYLFAFLFYHSIVIISLAHAKLSAKFMDSEVSGKTLPALP